MLQLSLVSVLALHLLTYLLKFDRVDVGVCLQCHQSSPLLPGPLQ